MMQVRCRLCGKKGRGLMLWPCINGDSSGGRPRACTPAEQMFAASGAGLQSLWSTLRGSVYWFWLCDTRTWLSMCSSK